MQKKKCKSSNQILKWEMKMEWKSHAGIHKEWLHTAPGGKQSYHTFIRQIYQPPYKKMTAKLSSSAEQPALYPVIYQDLGKAVSITGEKLMNFCWSGWILAKKSKSNTQRSVPNPDLPFQQVSPAFSPLWGFLQDNTQKIKGFKVWSQTGSVKWAHKTGPKPLFSIGSRMFTATQAQITKRKLLQKRHCHIYHLTFMNLLWYQRVLSSWRGNHQLCHHHHHHNWERGFLLPLAWTILLLPWGQTDPPRLARCLWSHSGRRDSPGPQIPAGDTRDLSLQPQGGTIITCSINKQLVTCFLAGSFQLRGTQRQTGLEIRNIFYLR